MSDHFERTEPDEPSFTVAVRRAEITFDGTVLAIRRSWRSDDPGAETIPIRQIVSIAVRRRKVGDRFGLLRLTLSNGRRVEIEFAGRHTKNVERLHQVVSRAVAAVPPWPEQATDPVEAD